MTVLMTNAVCDPVPVPVDTVVAEGVPAGVPVETTVAAVDGVKHAITDRVTPVAGWSLLVVKSTCIMLFAGNGVTGKPDTVLPLVEVTGLTRTTPSGERMVTVICLTLVFVGGMVTLTRIGVTPGANGTLIEPVGEMKLTPALPGARFAPVGLPT